MRLIYVLLVAVVIISCKSKTAKNKSQQVNIFTPRFDATGPPAMVYKTKADYNNLVPVILSDDRTTIVAYPHPSDVMSGDVYRVPSLLKNGYLLDNKGIGKNVAFINMTYEVYGKLKEVPPLSVLYDLIIDKDPLTELCNCGNKTALTNPVEQLNTLIDSGKLRSACLPIK